MFWVQLVNTIHVHTFISITIGVCVAFSLPLTVYRLNLTHSRDSPLGILRASSGRSRCVCSPDLLSAIPAVLREKKKFINKWTHANCRLRSHENALTPTHYPSTFPWKFYLDFDMVVMQICTVQASFYWVKLVALRIRTPCFCADCVFRMFFVPQPCLF